MTPNEPVNGWTIPTAIVYLTALMEGFQARTEDRIGSLRELIDERDKRAPTRDEIQEQFKTLEADIVSLRESRTSSHGERTGLHEQRTDSREDRRVWFAGGAFVIALVALLMQIFL